MPTDTDERIVGKKKSVRSAMFVFVFLTRKIAKINENRV
jgi:hypothetical protein